MASITGLVARYTGKANGVYREVIDETSSPRATSTTNVVVLIQSEQGPTMRPIYVEDADSLHAIFGNRNAKLEAKGSYGILVAEHVLETGPIWVLNIKNIAANEETLQVAKLACNNTDVERLLDENIATVYDTTKFWKVDPLYGTYGDDAVLSFASVLNGTVTIVIRKYDDMNYMYTVAETKQYNPKFLGEGLKDDAFVSDYLVKVDIYKTDLTKASINVPGLFVDGKINTDESVLAKLRSEANAKYFATYTGTVGNVIDRSGNNLSIVPLINADVNASGVWCSLNADAIAEHGIDLLGTEAFVFEGGEVTVDEITRLGETFTPANESVLLQVESDYVAYTAVPCRTGDILANINHYARVLKSQYVGDNITLDTYLFGTLQAPVMPDGKPFPKNTDGVPVYPEGSIRAGQPVVFDGHIKWYYKRNFAELGSWMVDIADEDTLQPQLVCSCIEYDNAGVQSSIDIEFDGSNFAESLAAELNATFEGSEFTVTGTVIDGFTIENTVAKAQTWLSIKSISDGITTIDVEELSQTKYGEYEDSTAIIVDDNSMTVRLENDEETTAIDVTAVKAMYGTRTKIFRLEFDRVINDGQVQETEEFEIEDYTVAVVSQRVTQMYRSFDADATAFKAVTPHVLTGIVSKDAHYVNGTLARQNEILDKMTSAGFIASFTDPTLFRCRYLVDSFKTYVAPNQKYQLAKLAGEAKRFPVFIPAPFYRDLRSSKNPSFYDTLGNFKMEYVALGSNPDVPSTNSFGYTKSEGSEWLIPVMNAMFNDGFADKVVPATGMIAKSYYAKHSGARKVYDIVAGQDWPLSANGVTGPEFDTSSDDRAAMQAMGTNVLQTISGSLQLRTSLTAFQTVMSALNYPETLEKVLFVADYCEPILNAKMFKYNNATTRTECKQRADDACAQLLADGAIGGYNNICDLSNNPIEVRKAGIIVLDTELYNEYGIVIAVHRITIKNSEE